MPSALLGHSPTKAPWVCLLCHSTVARQLAALKQGERATAGSDEGTHSRQSHFHGNGILPVSGGRPFRSLLIYRERERSSWRLS